MITTFKLFALSLAIALLVAACAQSLMCGDDSLKRGCQTIYDKDHKPIACSCATGVRGTL